MATKTKPQKPQNHDVNNLDQLLSVTFTRRELAVMFNELLRHDHKVGDGYVLFGALRKIEPLVAVATNIPAEEQGQPDKVMVGKETN